MSGPPFRSKSVEKRIKIQKAINEYNQDTQFRYLSNANFAKSTWRETLITALAFLLQPIVVPILIIFSRILKRPTKFFKVSIPVVKLHTGGIVPTKKVTVGKDIFDKMNDLEKEQSNKS